MQLPLYFAGANANSLRRKIQHESLRGVFAIAFYDTECDVAKSKRRISDPKRKGVKTLAPVHQSDVSHVEGTQRRCENRQTS